MKTTRYGNLYQLTRLTAFNNYLVREDDGFTLIDTNLPRSANGILEAARLLDGEIKRIIITHAHMDHAASLDALVEHLPNVEVVVSERTAAILAGDRSLHPDEPQAKLRGGYITTETKPTHTVTDGDVVGSLQIIASPGHTPGHIALFDTRDQTLIAGDALVTKGKLVVTGMFSLFFPFPAFATWHKPTALESARELRALKPTRLAVGHGKVLENSLDRLDVAIESAAQKWE